MDNLGNGGPQSTNGKEPLSPEAGPNGPQSPQTKPASGPAPVSRAPLNLGGANAATAAPAAAPPAAPAVAAPTATPRAPVPRPAPLRPAAAAAGAGRITGCKTFFTKLHPGAIDFLDDQINQWLKDNPTVIIKMTNTSVGEVQGKKTEANILMTVWYTGHATKSATHMG